MTNIAVTTTSFQVENRSWLASPHGTEPGATPTVTLDLSTFTAATHYANGYIPSGVVLGKITASGKYGPYLSTASDGRQTAAGILFSSTAIPNLLDLTKSPASAMLVHGFVYSGKLPIANAATGGGYIDAGGQTALNLIRFDTTAA